MKPFYYRRNQGYGGRGNSTTVTSQTDRTSQTKPTATKIAPTPKPTQKYVLDEVTKNTICENAYLGHKGYVIPKSCLPEKELEHIRTATTLTPKIATIPGQIPKPPTPIPYFRENAANIYLPRAFGIGRYGLPAETRLPFGRDARTALAFATDKPLRDYQQNIIDIYLNFVRSQQQTVATVVEEGVDSVETAIEENIEYGGGGILEVPCGRGKCLAKNTPVLMYNGSVKMVQDVVVGDFLMGDDSTPRTVLSITSGRDKMYSVRDVVSWEQYAVNQSHILSLRGIGNLEPVDIPITAYLALPEEERQQLFGYRVPIRRFGTSEFFNHDTALMGIAINPYVFGRWLMGDTVFVNKEFTSTSLFWKATHKHRMIPQPFKYGSMNTRLELIAGILDGIIAKNKPLFSECGKFLCIYFAECDLPLFRDVIFVLRSVGISVRLNTPTAQEQFLPHVVPICHHCHRDVTNKGPVIVIYNLQIWGQIKGVKVRNSTAMDAIRGLRKFCINSDSFNAEHLLSSELSYSEEDLLLYGIEIKELPEDEYFGFEIDGNRRFVLGDFTVTHNTVMALKIISELGRPALIYVNKGFLADQWIERVNTYLPGASVGRIQADKFDIEGRDIVICMIQTIYTRDYATNEVFRDFGITVIDEVHRIGSEEFSKAMFNITTPYVLGISATVDRKDGMEQSIKLFIGDVLFSDKRQDGDCVQVRCVHFESPNDEDYNRVETDRRTGALKYSTMMSKICEYGPRLDFLFKIIVDLVNEYPENAETDEDTDEKLSRVSHTPSGANPITNYFAKSGGSDLSTVLTQNEAAKPSGDECPLCNKNGINVAMSCGHFMCEKCMDDLDTPHCPICNKKFTIQFSEYSTALPNASAVASTNSAEKEPIEYPGQNQIIVLAQYRSVLRELYKRIVDAKLTTVGYYVGGMKEDDLEMSKGKQIILATYSMASEGLDIPTLATLLFATPRTDIQQSVGRILRQKHIRHPIVVDVVDTHSTFQNQLNKRRTYYRQNEYKIYKIGCEDYRKVGMQNITNEDGKGKWAVDFTPKNKKADSKASVCLIP